MQKVKILEKIKVCLAECNERLDYNLELAKNARYKKGIYTKNDMNSFYRLLGKRDAYNELIKLIEH